MNSAPLSTDESRILHQEAKTNPNRQTEKADPELLSFGERKPPKKMAPFGGSQTVATSGNPHPGDDQPNKEFVRPAACPFMHSYPCTCDRDLELAKYCRETAASVPRHKELALETLSETLEGLALRNCHARASSLTDTDVATSNSAKTKDWRGGEGNVG
jgi:hypothetical protein